MEINDEIYYNELFAEYSSLLSPAQKEIFDMYFGMDLSLGEIAEIKEISRQSVSDALSKARFPRRKIRFMPQEKVDLSAYRRAFGRKRIHKKRNRKYFGR